jgi:hypothetical protein
MRDVVGLANAISDFDVTCFEACGTEAEDATRRTGIDAGRDVDIDETVRLIEIEDGLRSWSIAEVEHIPVVDGGSASSIGEDVCAVAGLGNVDRVLDRRVVRVGDFGRLQAQLAFDAEVDLDLRFDVDVRLRMVVVDVAVDVGIQRTVGIQVAVEVAIAVSVLIAISVGVLVAIGIGVLVEADGRGESAGAGEGEGASARQTEGTGSSAGKREAVVYSRW